MKKGDIILSKIIGLDSKLNQITYNSALNRKRIMATHFSANF